MAAKKINRYVNNTNWRQRLNEKKKNLTGRAQGSTGYMNIVAMLIESYALESIWLLAMPVVSGGGGVSAFFVESAVYIEVSSQ
jgi:hypothetical protein